MKRVVQLIDRFGNEVRIGDLVTTKGKTGWGQPLVMGELVSIHHGMAEVRVSRERQPLVTRKRSLRNISRVVES